MGISTGIPAASPSGTSPGSSPAPSPLAGASAGAAASALPAGLDAIEITGIRAWGYTGYFPEEQTLGQWFEVDLTIWLDLSLTAADDQLENTLNYADVVSRVKTLLETARHKTIERLNAVVIEAVLAFPQVHTVHSRLVKVTAPIPGFEGRIAIVMTRTRGDQT